MKLIKSILEFSKDPISLLLLFVSVNTHSWPSIPPHHAGQLVRLPLGSLWRSTSWLSGQTQSLQGVWRVLFPSRVLRIRRQSRQINIVKHLLFIYKFFKYFIILKYNFSQYLHILDFLQEHLILYLKVQN